MPFIPPSLILKDQDVEKRIKKQGLDVRDTTWVFENLRDRFAPTPNPYFLSTTGSQVRSEHVGFGCVVIRQWTNKNTGTSTLVGQQGLIQAVSLDGKEARVLLQGARSRVGDGETIYTPDVVPVGILRRGHCVLGSWKTIRDLLPLEMGLSKSAAWTHNRGFVRDANNELFSMDNFNLAKPQAVVHSASTQASGNPFTYIIYWNSPTSLEIGGTGNQYHIAFKDEVPGGSTNVDGVNFPLAGTEVYITVQMRSDGKRHAQSWARLPLIQIFGDWERACSWAVMVRWKDPTGQWRRRWIQTKTMDLIDKNIKGSFKPYAHGTAILRMFLNERREPNDAREWIPTFPSLRIYTVKYDHLTTTRTISLAPNDNNPPSTDFSSRRIAPNDIKAQMATLPSLSNVGTTRPLIETNLGVQLTSGSRVKCDCCLILDCKKCIYSDGNDAVCKKCAERGIPTCSWSDSLVKRRGNMTQLQIAVERDMYRNYCMDDAAPGVAYTAEPRNDDTDLLEDVDDEGTEESGEVDEDDE